jgi:hypothetical protein
VRLSSIFSFSTFQVRTRLSSWIVVLIAFAILAEMALRIPSVIERLPEPEPTLWHADLIQTKLDYLKAFEAERGIDVLVMGNSAMQSALAPHIFDISRGRKDDSGPGAFNAALEGMPPYGTLMFLEIYSRYSDPDVIIYGITPQDLNSNSPWARDITDRINHSPLALAESRQGLRGRLIASLLNYSRLYRYRLVLYQLLLSGTTRPPQEVYFDTRGFHPIDRRLSDVPSAERGVFLNNAGVLNYNVQGIQLESLRALINYSQDRDIDLVLVSMPLADDYYGNFDSPEDYQTYLSTITQVASEFHVPLWDLENLSPARGFSDADFADFNHLNRDGAERFSAELGERFRKLVDAAPAAGLH